MAVPRPLERTWKVTLTATFKLTAPITLTSIPQNKVPVTTSATGDLTLHGVTKSVTFDVSAQRNGDKIDINVKVAGLNDPGTDKKLRILLAEETVRYVGSNKIRFHHNVVRAFPGGVAGKALTEAATKQNVSLSIGDLRGSLALLTRAVSGLQA